MSKLKPRVFSYVRYSSGPQGLGDSERRQVDDAEAWAKRNGYTLDDSVPLTDRGVSGFSGAHRRKGKLGGFLVLVEKGSVPAGSILVVENIDRLSREGPVKALREVIFKLWERGIVLQTLSPELTYPPDCDQTMEFTVLMMLLQQAQEESRKKGERVRKARETAREEARDKGRLLTGRVPAWLKVTWEDRSDQKRPRATRLEPIPAAADAIRTIFDMKLKGIGIRSIEAKLNADGPWTPPKSKKRKGEGWRCSYIRKILQNPAVTGRYQPFMRVGGKRLPTGDEIVGYYPGIVKPSVFLAVQERFKSNTTAASNGRRTGRGGRRGKAKNLLRHLAVCAYCGGPMAFVDKSGPRHEDGRYLVCDNGRRGVTVRVNGRRRAKCSRHTVRYGEAETLVLENCPQLRPGDVLPDPGELVLRCQGLRQRVEGKAAELADIDRQLENLTDQIARTANRAMRTRYEAKCQGLDGMKANLEAEKAAEETELAKAAAGSQSFEAWKANLDGLRKALDGGDVEIRERLQSHLREFIDQVEIFATGHRKVFDREAAEKARRDAERRLGKGKLAAILRDPAVVEAEDGDTFLESDEPSDYDFDRWVLARRMTREGRFIRVHFKTGARIALLPPGSLATGYVLQRDEGGTSGWLVKGPDMAKLLREFEAEKRGKGRKG